MLTHRITSGWSRGSENIVRSFDLSAGAENNIDETIPAGANNLAVAFALDVSQLKALFMLSDKDVTVETNSGAAPINTFALKAGVPFVWNTNDASLRDTAGTAVATDVTGLFLTNAGASDALLQIRALLDPTI